MEVEKKRFAERKPISNLHMSVLGLVVVVDKFFKNWIKGNASPT
jgi:hypothetical protein